SGRGTACRRRPPGWLRAEENASPRFRAVHPRTGTDSSLSRSQRGYSKVWSQARTAAVTACRSVLKLWSPATSTTVRRAAAGGTPNGSRSPWRTRVGTVTASSSARRLGRPAPERPGGCSGNARQRTATAPVASAVRQAPRAPEERRHRVNARRRASVREERYHEAGVAAEQDGPHDGLRPVALANLVESCVERVALGRPERQRELERTVVLEVRDRDSDEGETLAL